MYALVRQKLFKQCRTVDMVRPKEVTSLLITRLSNLQVGMIAFGMVQRCAAKNLLGHKMWQGLA